MNDKEAKRNALYIAAQTLEETARVKFKGYGGKLEQRRIAVWLKWLAGWCRNHANGQAEPFPTSKENKRLLDEAAAGISAKADELGLGFMLRK